MLLVDPRSELEVRVDEALVEAGVRDRFHIVRVATVGMAIARTAEERPDVILLALPSAQPGVLSLVELRTGVPQTPTVVLAAWQDESLALKAVQLGAADYLIAERLYGTLVVRCLRHAVEAERVRRTLAEYQAQLPPSLAEGDPQAAAASLRVALPEQFASLVEEYRRLLDGSVERVLRRSEQPLGSGIRRLAERAGELRASARDVVEVHAAAMEAKQGEEGAQRFQLYAAEGRVRLLEMMGHLVAYYRRLSLPGRPRPHGE